ncbi:MAG: hypothetical protein LBL01_02885, partial [Bifidobacteriaceae bacterium]|nr:hypothetical protein [Bifidobacteriaceae bacterium]
STWPEWSALTWPGNPEPFASRLFTPLSDFMVAGEVDHTIKPALEGLRRIPGPLGVVSASCLALGLGVKNRDVSQQAVEWFAEAVGFRVSAPDLVSAMTFVAPGVLCHRWAAALGEAATISTPTAAAVREVLTGLLPGMDPTQARIGTLIQLLLDETVRAGEKPTDPALLSWLARFTGTGKAAKAATQLAKLA